MSGRGKDHAVRGAAEAPRLSHDPRLLDRPQTSSADYTRDELEAASRNHAFYLEMLGLDTTPAGAHYVVLHFDIPLVSTDTWRLSIGGLVARPLSLTLADLRRPRSRSCDPRVRGQWASPSRTRGHHAVVRGGLRTAQWAGTPLRDLLVESVSTSRAVASSVHGLRSGSQGIDHYYERALPRPGARSRAVRGLRDERPALAAPARLPARLMVPGWYGGLGRNGSTASR